MRLLRTIKVSTLSKYFGELLCCRISQQGKINLYQIVMPFVRKKPHNPMCHQTLKMTKSAEIKSVENVVVMQNTTTCCGLHHYMFVYISGEVCIRGIYDT